MMITSIEVKHHSEFVLRRHQLMVAEVLGFTKLVKRHVPSTPRQARRTLFFQISIR
jgi:hypothetical protein